MMMALSTFTAHTRSAVVYGPAAACHSLSGPGEHVDPAAAQAITMPCSAGLCSTWVQGTRFCQKAVVPGSQPHALCTISTLQIVSAAQSRAGSTCLCPHSKDQLCGSL